MDDESKELAMVVLKNAFYHDFSALVNSYIRAAEGLLTDTQEVEERLSELTSVYGRSEEAADTELNPIIWTQHLGYTTGHETMLEALESDGAIEITLQGLPVFVKINNEWHLAE